MVERRLSQKVLSTSVRQQTFDTELLIKRIEELENQIRLSKDNDLNPINDLVQHLVQLNSLGGTRVYHRAIHALIYCLHRTFSSLIRQGRIHASPSECEDGESVKLVKNWLRDRYEEFIEGLFDLLYHQAEGSEQIGLDGLTILMSLVRNESEVMRSLRESREESSGKIDRKKYPNCGFESKTFKRLVKVLIQSSPQGQASVSNDVRAEFITRYFNFCDDIRYYFLKEAAQICRSHVSSSTELPNQKSKGKSLDTAEITLTELKNLTKNLLIYLGSLSTMPTETDELNQFWTGRPTAITTTHQKKRSIKSKSKPFKKVRVEADGSTGMFDDTSDSDETDEASQPVRQRDLDPLLSLRSHQKAFSECWLALLSLPLTELEIKKVLNILHSQVIPNMIDPKFLMDFLVDCVDSGGSIAILSLNALFILMSKHNLDYPAFYTRLYALLDRNVFHGRHRPRFFRMLEKFLSSTHLPVNIVASFLKRISRLCLFSPPGAIIASIPFCYNLIKRHPSCMSMLHRDDRTETLGVQEKDPFDEDEIDPMETDAIFSSLWELSSLRNHYLASISTLSKVFSESFDKPQYELEDFLDHTYNSLFQTELDRQIRKPPALSIFASSYKSTEVIKSMKTDDIVTQMWNI
ncbi:CBF/Mak21 family-domain-containing protein [Phakopsora pachyrhizi]|uniref:CBF/Mak21 family-domain-containing protein n=1 Tax=Phakopsora pachyrhizi TaxID=170000 RepID=A0AAV0BBD0_PHAPC|nr:CBF/Mak21 family-domain-containing protein [Phakopsora pachyrhizi]CAH7683568.1 CBF/Mak21 family-domain-containing protein [Phakopsora pachyrhizi]